MKKTKIVLLIGLVAFFLIPYYHCPIHTIFDIACPGCGLTRGFLAILHLDLKTAIYSNILSIPLFLFCIVSIGFIIRDIIRHQDTYLNTVFHYLQKYSLWILLLLLITMIINNIHGI